MPTACHRSSTPSMGPLLLMLMIAGLLPVHAVERHDQGAEHLGFKLSLQAWTAHHTTLWDTIDIAQSVGIKYLELYPGQPIGGGIEGKFDHTSSAEIRAKVLARLTEAGIKPIAYGVLGLGKNEQANRVIFDFAKAMGMEVINAEPSEDAFDVIDRQAQEYQMKIGLHNHPKASRYWNPQHVLEVVTPWSTRIGSCADTGHWPRSELDPVDAITLLKGRIVSSHLKETDKIGRGARDVVYGTGAGRSVKDQLIAFKAVGFRGPLALEYEAGKQGQELLDHLRAMVAYFDQVTTELAR